MTEVSVLNLLLTRIDKLEAEVAQLKAALAARDVIDLTERAPDPVPALEV